MGPVSAQTTIDVPREQVFAFLADLARRPAICDHFIDEYRLERIPPAGEGAAARFRFRRHRLWAETVIIEARSPSRIVERGSAGRLGRIPIQTAWELSLAASPSACQVTVSFATEPSHPLDRLREGAGAARWYRRQWARALARLKETLEGGVVVEPVRVAGADRIPQPALSA